MKLITTHLYLFMAPAVSVVHTTDRPDGIRIVDVTEHRWHLIPMFQFTLFHVREILLSDKTHKVSVERDDQSDESSRIG
jgi:hypothetical protein